MVLRKYSRGQIPISGEVDLEFAWKGKMIVSPVHICSDKEIGEPLLLNMNVVIPPGLMQPVTGVEARQNQKKSPSVGTVRV